MSTSRVYTLAFCPKDISIRNAPEIVVECEKQILDDFFACVERMAHECQKEVCEHLFKKDIAWEMGTAYGYGGCATVLYDTDAVRLHFPLAQETMHEVVDTVRLTFATLATFLGHESQDGEKKMQWCEVQTYVCPNQLDYRIQGYMSEYAKACIGARIGGSDQRISRHEIDPHHNAIESAMSEVWSVLTPPSLHRYASRCALRVGEDGYFQLLCHGNMCELYTYPQMGVSQCIGSYGVYAPHQQLTLLAGFSRLIELCE